MTTEELKRVNIRVTPEVYEWFMNKSKRTGVSMSSLMFLALEAHVQQQLSLPYTCLWQDESAGCGGVKLQFYAATNQDLFV
ncbi:hypothetical protein [Alicyclobacillus fodiniaquatilis]|uniref:CopG antitoxin of type II toxin-antitoxin system n=1 Tax=Alicyclobacillus fodiniaquatilis TaxID=1661150 RepID=A0ABW4JEF2_9BACL